MVTETTPGKRPMRYSVERLPRTTDLRALLGWRYKVILFAWDDETDRFRPAPLSVPGGSLFGWQGRACTFGRADDLGLRMVDRWRAAEAREVARLAAVAWKSLR